MMEKSQKERMRGYMAKKELKLRAFVSPTETVVVSAYDKDGKAEACTLAFS